MVNINPNQGNASGKIGGDMPKEGVDKHVPKDVPEHASEFDQLLGPDKPKVAPEKILGPDGKPLPTNTKKGEFVKGEVAVPKSTAKKGEVLKENTTLGQKVTPEKSQNTQRKGPVIAKEKFVAINKGKPTEALKPGEKEVKLENLKNQKVETKDISKENLKSAEEGVRQVVGQNMHAPEGAVKVDEVKLPPKDATALIDLAKTLNARIEVQKGPPGVGEKVTISLGNETADSRFSGAKFEISQGKDGTLNIKCDIPAEAGQKLVSQSLGAHMQKVMGENTKVNVTIAGAEGREGKEAGAQGDKDKRSKGLDYFQNEGQE